MFGNAMAATQRDEPSAEPTDLHSVDWLALPSAKKEVALARARILDDYVALSRPSGNDTVRAIDAMSLAKTRFFALLKGWRANRSLVALAPHAGTVRKRERPEAEPSSSAAILNGLIAGMTDRSYRPVHTRALADWPAGTPRPPRLELRAVVDEVVAKPSNGFSLVAKHGAGAKAEMADAFGEVVVIDHTAPRNLFVPGPDGPVRPTMTLAIDLYSATVVGIHVSTERPGSRQVALALADTVRAAAVNTERTIVPRLMLNTDWRPEWLDLIRMMEGVAAGLTIRRTPNLNHGVSTLRLVGATLGRLELAPRASHERTGLRDAYDPERHFLLPLDEADRLIRADAAVPSDRHTADIPLAAIDLPFDGAVGTTL